MKADIDIDLPDRSKLLELIRHIPARYLHDGKVRKHNSGIYVTDIPYDPIHGCAAIDYEAAEARGYFKIDLLNMSVYQLIRDPEHYAEILAMEPIWSKLWTDAEWAARLVHIGAYTQLLESMRPDTIPRLAALISIIRPGKAHLQNRPWDEVFASVWDGDDSRGYIFKKAHAISYAMLVTVHMNILTDGETLVN